MLKKIESVRTKPKEVRNRYAFWFAFGFTAFIVLFWLVSIPSRLAGLTSFETESPIEVEGGISRSLSNLRASISNGMDAIRRIPDDTLPSESESAEVPSDNIDFSTFFATTTANENNQIKFENQGKPVLISTTSQARSTSTTN